MSSSRNAGGKSRVVDFRSDVLTQPSAPMKQAMMEVRMGDDVFGEDPTVNALQQKVATLLGKEAAILLPSGTMANLIAVLTHCQVRGSEAIMGDRSHIYIYEQAGVSQLGGVHTLVVKNLPDGTFDLGELRRAVREDDCHFPVTTLVCAENTHNVAGGKVTPQQWVDELGATCRQLGLPLHMDGARLLNAATALGLPPARLVQDCTTVCICLSKGLGAPVGSVLAGPAEFIERSRRLRKALGGGWRQPGMLAAAGIFALDQVFPSLGRDHDLVQQLARGVAGLGSKIIHCDPAGAHTNILMVECDPKVVSAKQLHERLEQVTEGEVTSLGESVIIRTLVMSDAILRFVVYHDITPEDIQSTVRKIQYVIKELDPEF